jgi:hypothetical protein
MTHDRDIAAFDARAGSYENRMTLCNYRHSAPARKYPPVLEQSFQRHPLEARRTAFSVVWVSSGECAQLARTMVKRRLEGRQCGCPVRRGQRGREPPRSSFTG